MSSDIIVISPNRRPSEIAIGDSANLDAFSRVRTSDPYSLFQTQLQYDADPLQMETGSTGTGSTAYNTSTRMLSLQTTAGNGKSYTQTLQYIPYQAGKSQLIKITGVMESAVANVVKETGIFDSFNGIFYRQNGTAGLQFVLRSYTSGGVVDNAINQSSWNLDTLDGTGTSGITLDVTKNFIFLIDLQFLGMGRVRVGFNIDGTIVYAHEFLNANVLSVPYMQTATLPVQMLMTAAGSATTATMKFKCAAVESEGGVSEIGYSFASADTAVTAASGTDTHLLSIRPLTTFNGLTNRSLFKLESVDMIVTGNNPVLWKLCIGSTFSVAPTYAAINATYSAFEQGTGGTLTAAGTVIHSGYIAATASSKQSESAVHVLKYPITLDRAGAVRALGTLSLIVQGIGGTSATRALMNINEVR